MLARNALANSHHLLRFRCGFVGLFAFALHPHQLRARGEVIETLAFEIGQRFEFVFLHESEQLLAHALHHFIAMLHYASANPRGVCA